MMSLTIEDTLDDPHLTFPKTSKKKLCFMINMNYDNFLPTHSIVAELYPLLPPIFYHRPQRSELCILEYEHDY